MITCTNNNETARRVDGSVSHTKKRKPQTSEVGEGVTVGNVHTSSRFWASFGSNWADIFAASFPPFRFLSFEFSEVYARGRYFEELTGVISNLEWG